MNDELYYGIVQIINVEKRNLGTLNFCNAFQLIFFNATSFLFVYCSDILDNG